MNGYYVAYAEARNKQGDMERIRFTRSYVENDRRSDSEQQYDVECELLERASRLGEVEMYTVNFEWED